MVSVAERADLAETLDRWLRRERLSIAKVIEHGQLSRNTVYRVKDGTPVSAESLRKLAKGLASDPFTGQVNRATYREALTDLYAAAGIDDPLEGASAEPAPNVVAVPIVRYLAHASADAISEETGDFVYVDEAESRGRKLLAARVTGACMWPDIEPGEIVVWDAHVLRGQEGDMVAFRVDGNFLVKRVYYDPDGSAAFIANDGSSVGADQAIIEGVVVKVIREKRPERRPRPPVV